MYCIKTLQNVFLFFKAEYNFLTEKLRGKYSDHFFKKYVKESLKNKYNINKIYLIM